MEAKKTVVIVDDEVDLTDLFSSLLEDSYNVVTFNRPKDFLEYLSMHKTIPFDALVSDFNMPQLNGLDMLKKAFELGYNFPFILFSAFLEKQVILKALQIGAFRLLEKPASKTTLEEAIKSVIDDFDMIRIRKDIRASIDQLREYYSFMSLVLKDKISEEKKQAFLVELDKNGETHAKNPEDVLNQLEQRIDKLFNLEEELEKRKQKILKSA